MIKRQNIKGSVAQKITFVIPHDPSQGRVYVAGDFNDWSQSDAQLIKRNNNTRSVSLILDPGKYTFRYCTEDGEWFNDEAADAYELGAHGEDNSVIEVG